MSIKSVITLITGIFFFFVLSIFLFEKYDPSSPNPQGDMIISNVYVDSIDVLILESFPVQVNVVIKGKLADPCSEIGDIAKRLQDHTFTINITTNKPEDATCSLDSKSFEEVVSLDVQGLTKGTYSVKAGNVSKSFVLSVDNKLLTPN